MITDKAHPSQYTFIGDALPQTSVATVPIHYESRLAKLEGNAEVARELTYCLCNALRAQQAVARGACLQGPR